MLVPVTIAVASALSALPPLYVSGVDENVEVVAREMSRDFEIVRGTCPDLACAQVELVELRAPIGLLANATSLVLINKDGALASRMHDSAASLAVGAIELVDPSPAPRASDLAPKREVIDKPVLNDDDAPRATTAPKRKPPPATEDDSNLGVIIAACAGGALTLCGGFVGFASGCNPNNCGDVGFVCGDLCSSGCNATCVSMSPLDGAVRPSEVPLARAGGSGAIAY